MVGWLVACCRVPLIARWLANDAADACHSCCLGALMVRWLADDAADACRVLGLGNAAGACRVFRSGAEGCPSSLDGWPGVLLMLAI